MTQEVNIILSDSSDPIIDSSGNLKSCKNKKALGTKEESNCDKEYEFTPLSCYRNPVTWLELFLLIIVKIIFVIIFAYSEDWGWALVYLSTLVGFIFYIYIAATYDYSYKNILHLSNFYENPWWIFWTIVMNILFYVVMILCGIVVWGENKLLIVFFFEVIIWATFFAILVADAYRYLLHKHLLLDVAIALGLTTEPENKPLSETPVQTPVHAPEQEDEVFNIAGNEYTFKEAKAVCKAFGAGLANYEQIEDAYHKGAEWVNYGWSEGQYAYFPLQKATWAKMDQTNPENANGKIRPGISGGYFANPDIKFGVNCFGKKPKRRDQDIRNILPGNPPVTPEDKELNEKVDFYKKNAKLHAFNTEHWYKDPTKVD